MCLCGEILLSLSDREAKKYDALALIPTSCDCGVGTAEVRIFTETESWMYGMETTI